MTTLPLRSLFTAASFLFCLFTNAQNNVGIGTTPNASAKLDVSSTTQGMLVPRMTTAQRDAISTPANALMVYNTTVNAFQFWNGTAWAAVGGSSASAYPNIEVRSAYSTQQSITGLFNTATFNTLTFPTTNGANATLTGGNTWDGTTFTVGTTGAGWYQITGQFVGVASGSNAVTTVGYQVVVDRNNAFGTTATVGTYPFCISTYNSSTSSSILKNVSTLSNVVYLAAADVLNLRAQSWSTSTAANTSTDGSSNIQITRLR